MTQLFGVYSTVEGPDGNGLLTPFDPGAGGIGGSATTTNASPTLCSGAILPPDKQSTDVEVIVRANQGPVGGPPTSTWRARIGATVIRSGNTLTIEGPLMRTDVRSSAALAAIQAALVVNTAVTPNLLAVQVIGLATPPQINWSWRGLQPYSL